MGPTPRPHADRWTPAPGVTSGRKREKRMPLPRQDVDGTTPKYLRDKYAVVGIGETTYTRGSGITTRALGSWAGRNAILNSVLKPLDVDGMLDYSGGYSTSATFIAGYLGLRLNF